MFINISNHPFGRWGAAQREAALALGGGDIRDIPFPNVPASATSEDVAEMAAALIDTVAPKQGDIVMCQGEFSLTLTMVTLLKAAGVTCVVACTERKVQERELEGGKVEKTAVFEFVQFREII